MAEISTEQVREFIADVNSHDGPGAKKILDEVGPCGWSSLMNKASKPDVNQQGAAYPSLADVVLEADSSSGSEEKVTLWAGIRGTAVPMAHSEGKVCKDQHKK